jgi:hydroxymethylglutaryl-CoA lyase
MSDLPKKVRIREVGPREGFQFEKAPISTEDKIRFVDSLSATGVKSIEFVSFVSPKWVPQMADAEAWVAGIDKKPGVEYIGIWLNVPGLERAIKQSDKLTIRPSFSLPASNTFSMKNTNKPVEQKLDEMPDYVNRYKSLGMDTLNIGVSVAFGCNYEGAIPGERVIDLLKKQEAKAKDLGMKIGDITLMDTMGWANPMQIKRVVGEVRNRWPGHEVSLHLHDTRGLAIANFMAGLEMGVAHYDAAVAGLGGCPFAAHKGAAGNICTEDTVFICQEMGIETGIDLDRMIECAEQAERLVGHPLPGKVKVGGNLANYRNPKTVAA